MTEGKTTPKEDKNGKKTGKTLTGQPLQQVDTTPTLKVTKEAAGRAVVVTWGRMNPPTAGHEMLVNKVKSLAKSHNADAKVFLSHSQDKKKNPLSYLQKIKYAKKAFGRIVQVSDARTIIEVLKQLQDSYSKVIIVVGSDRVTEFKNFTAKYNKKEYDFEELDVVSAGERDPDAEGISGMSASKLRDLAAKGEINTFVKGLPGTINDRDAKSMYKDIRKGMSINEETELDEAIKLGTKVKIHAPGKDYHGQVGTVGEIRHGLFKNAPKTYTVDYGKDGKQSIQLRKLNVKVHKEDMDIDEARKTDTWKTITKILPHVQAASDKQKQAKERLEKNTSEYKKVTEATALDKVGGRPNIEKANKRFSGIIKATKKQFANDVKEEVEPEIIESSDSGLAAKAKESGISIDTLRKVYRRGVAAWNSGHRPGTTPQQWGMARVNSYITKGKTFHTADKDLHDSVNLTQEETIAVEEKVDLPHKYRSGLSDKTAAARKSHWKKMAKYSDKDPRAYEPAPGDKTAKTKESKYTKKYREMYGEEEVTEWRSDGHYTKSGKEWKGDQHYNDVKGKVMTGDKPSDDSEELFHFKELPGKLQASIFRTLHSKKNRNHLQSQKKLDTIESVDEALTIQQRMKRRATIKRLKSRLIRGRRIAKRKMADKGKLEKRSRRKAIEFLRKRLSGGKSYRDMTTGEKIIIDKKLDKKKTLIGKIAKRLFPRVRKAEAERLASVRNADAVKNLHTTKIKPLKHPKEGSVKIVMNSFDYNSLKNKAKKNSISENLLLNVFMRGLKLYNEDDTPNLTDKQFAFNRVNSFISKGKAFIEDKDLFDINFDNKKNIIIERAKDRKSLVEESIKQKIRENAKIALNKLKERH